MDIAKSAIQHLKGVAEGSNDAGGLQKREGEKEREGGGERDEERERLDSFLP